jgi:hypothetical protein
MDFESNGVSSIVNCVLAHGNSTGPCEGDRKSTEDYPKIQISVTEAAPTDT